MYLRSLIILSMLLLALALGSVTWLMLAPAAPVAATAEALHEAPPPPPARIRILVAARALPAGTLLKDEDFLARELAPDAAREAMLHATAENRAEIRGALLRRYLDPGDAVERPDVLRVRDRGFLAAVLRPGMRAISVGVDVVTGTAGLIWPGDHVDLILTQELAAGEVPLAQRVIGETVLADIRVIAVDQQLTQGAGGDATPARIARTVTLEVQAEQAERVAIAGRLGRIALAVRAADAPAPTPDIALQGPTGRSLSGSDVSQALARTSRTQGRRMQVIQGDERIEVNFR